MLETNDIAATCFFDTIRVNGSIYIQGTLNDRYVDELLSDVVYKHEPAPIVRSFKRFKSLRADLFLNSQLINRIPLSDYMTTDTDQIIDIKNVYSNIYFDKLQLNGAFDSINITELDENAIKLSGEQYTEVKFVFEDDIDVNVNELEIRKTINKVDVDGFVSIDEDFEVHGDITLNSLEVNECTISGTIKSPFKNSEFINEYEIKELERVHLSKTSEQKITAPYIIDMAIVRGDFKADYVNTYHLPSIYENLKNLKSNEEQLELPYVNVNYLEVNGSIVTDDLNGYDFNGIVENVIWLNRPNNISGNMEFLDEVEINGDLTVLQLNAVDFDEFANDLALKSDENITIHGTTIFKNSILVEGDIDATKLNHYTIDTIFTKYYSKPINNPINVYGDISMTNLNFKGTFNGVSSNYLKETYAFDEILQAHVLTANVQFNKMVTIERLDLEAGANNVPHVKTFLTNIIRKDRPSIISASKFFTHPVVFDCNLHIVKNNEIDVQYLLANIVLINQDDPIEIETSVVFEGLVNATILRLNDLFVTHILNWPTNEWYQNAIRLDLPFKFDGKIRFSDGALEASSINAHWLNEHSLGHVLTLYTPQTFTSHVSFGEVHATSTINVGGTVNGMILPEERKNTLMVIIVLKKIYGLILQIYNHFR